MSEQFLSELRAEVVAAAGRVDAVASPQPDHERGRGPGRLLAMAAAASLVVVLAAAVFVSRPDPVQADVEVIRVGDELVVKLSDVETRPEEIEEAARRAGLDIDVTTAPVSPSNVGRFVSYSGSGELPAQLRVVAGDPTSSFNGFRIPVDFGGTLDLTLGRAARPGEAWALTANATSKGEVLACRDLEGLDLGGVIDLLDDEGVEYQVIIPEGGGEVSGGALDAWRSSAVLAVSSVEPDRVTIDAGAAPREDVLVQDQVGC